jgi:hypothetical protein
MLDSLRAIGETHPQGYAPLYDRVMLSQEFPNGVTALAPDGRKQRFGTQGTCVHGAWEPFALEDPSRVDELRASVGLRPLAEYRKSFNCR